MYATLLNLEDIETQKWTIFACECSHIYRQTYRCEDSERCGVREFFLVLAC